MVRRFVLPMGVTAALLTAACQTVPNNTSSANQNIAPDLAMYHQAILMQSAPSGVPNLTGAKDLLEKAAAAGSAEAMDRLGDMYRTGDGGVSRDVNQALAWYRKEGDLSTTRPGKGAWGLIKVGQAYERGTAGLEKSSLDAEEWYKKAAVAARTGAANGDGFSMIALAFLMANGKGIKEDDVQAWNWAIKAIELDKIDALDLMAEFYAYGQGLPADDNEAFKATLGAAQLGLVDDMVDASLGFMKGDGAPVDAPAALEWMQKAVDRGNSRAMREMGNFYHQGLGLQRNDATARTWYQKAIDLNDPVALGLMGQLIQPRDPSEAATWYEKGAAAGDPGSMYWLAAIYIDPTGTNRPKDLQKAIQLLQTASEWDYGPAMARMGQLYEEGTGVQASASRALGWYRRAAALEDPEGMYRLANILIGPLNVTSGIPQQYPEAKSWLIKSANAGFGPAMTELGQIYSRGIGKDRLDRDPVTAAKWYQKGARAGEPISMREYGELVVEGKYAPRDYRAAADWFNRAVQAGDTIAIIDQGSMYEKGQGVEVNYRVAMDRYREAERRGEPSAKAAIGHLFQDGLGVPQDPQRAITFYLEGAAANDLTSVEALAQTYEFGKGVLIDNTKTRDYYKKALALGSDIADDWLDAHPEFPTTAPGGLPNTNGFQPGIR